MLALSSSLLVKPYVFIDILVVDVDVESVNQWVHEYNSLTIANNLNSQYIYK